MGSILLKKGNKMKNCLISEIVGDIADSVYEIGRSIWLTVPSRIRDFKLPEHG